MLVFHRLGVLLALSLCSVALRGQGTLTLVSPVAITPGAAFTLTLPGPGVFYYPVGPMVYPVPVQAASLSLSMAPVDPSKTYQSVTVTAASGIVGPVTVGPITATAAFDLARPGTGHINYTSGLATFDFVVRVTVAGYPPVLVRAYSSAKVIGASSLGLVGDGRLLVHDSLTTLPMVALTADGNASTSEPFDSGPARVQYVYDSSHFISAWGSRPVIIGRMRMRADAAVAAPWVGSSITSLQVDLSTAPVDYQAISSVFANNNGPDITRVFDDTLDIRPGTTAGGTPGPWVAEIEFATPFVYDPALGDLTIDLRSSGVLSTVGTPAFDAVTTPGVAKARRVTAASPGSVSGTVSTGEVAGVLELDYAIDEPTPQGLIIAPENTFVTQPSSSSSVWRTTAFRTQLIYDTTHFTNQGVVGPISIDRLRFRAANGNTAAGGVYAGDGATFGVNLAIGTSLSDYLAPSTTFANNRGVMQTVLQNATVTVAAGAGTTPNDYVIDVTIPGGFVYDPTLGDDLLLEIDAPVPAPATIPVLVTGASQAINRSVRISSAGQAAATGTISGLAGVVLFDVSGGPGGVATIVPGTVTDYGSGCYDNVSRAFAELFPVATPTLDLGAGITLLPNAPGAPTAYLVTSGAGAFVAPTATVPLLSNAATPGVMGDDATSAALSLSFSFPYPGGSTNVLHATTNGEILLTAVTATGSDFSPTLAEMASGTSTHAGRPRLLPCWYDLYANRNVSLNPLAGVHFEEDTVNQTAIITWNDVGELATAAPGAKSFNIQVVLSASGSVEIRYGAMAAFGSTLQPKLVGFSPGAPVLVPASRDFSALTPFVSNTTDVPFTPLLLSIAPAPKLGSTVDITTHNMPAVGVGVNLLSVTQLPGIDLGIVGMPGCRAYVAPDVGTTLIGSPTASYTFGIPNIPTLVGLQLFSQSLALDATLPNSFGAITSNGVAMTVGTVN